MQVDSSDSTGLVAKPYHAKRPHTKSRSGCKSCKTRKVKCNEARPACSNCVLRKATCVYPSLATTTTPRNRSPPQAESSSGRLATPVLSQSLTTWQGSRVPGVDDFGSPLLLHEPLFVPEGVSDATDLKLMWFYTTHVFSSFLTGRTTCSKEVDEILKIKIPVHAFSHPFLMNTVLGLSAIQLLHQDSDAKLIENVEPKRIFRYRARAFEGYRQALADAKPETYPALMATSLLLIGVASQTFREPDGKDLFILDWMVLWRGVSLIFSLLKPQGLLESGMVELFYRPPVDLDQSSAHIPNSLLFLVATPVSSVSPLPGADEYDTDDNPGCSRTAYYQALQYIGSLYRELRLHGIGPRFELRVVTWFTFLPERFIRLASARRPRAMLIMSHYLMFVKLVRTIWWTKGIADREIPSITQYILDTQPPAIRAWAAPYLTTPHAVARAQSETEVVRIILDDPGWEPDPEPRDEVYALDPPVMKPFDVPAAETPPVNNSGPAAGYSLVDVDFCDVGMSTDVPRQQQTTTMHSPAPSAGTSSTESTLSATSADLEDVAMEKLHLDSNLAFGSLDVMLGGMTDKRA